MLGLRCVYHGWKFDADGNCVDLPSEAATSPMKNGVKITAYPTVERGGLVWAYLGPKEHQPGPPDFEWTRVPSTHCHVSKTFEDCNWLQALEGGLDTAHGSFLHNNQLGNKKLLRQRDGAPKIDVEKTDYGYYYVSTRKPQPDEHYVRVYQYIMPAQQMRANVMGREGGRNESRSSTAMSGCRSMTGIAASTTGATPTIHRRRSPTNITRRSRRPMAAARTISFPAPSI